VTCSHSSEQDDRDIRKGEHASNRQAGPVFTDRLNSDCTQHALQIFMLVVLAHWAKHLAQAAQIYLLGWRGRSPTAFRLWYPWLITSELMHNLYALIMLIGLWVLRKGLRELAASGGQ
jgi:hypothetical protein